MTVRALVLGLTAALFIAAFGYVNNQVIQLEPLESGHLMPVSVLGLLVLTALLFNPLTFWFWRPATLRPAELAVAVTLMLVACSIPGRGLMEQFTTTLAMPMHWNRMEPGWQRIGLLDYVPAQMFPADKQNDPEVIGAFVVGSGQRKHWNPRYWIPIGDVPWEAWRRPMRTWVPLLVLCATAVMCLALIVHRQWSRHEHLPYPIAAFTASLMDRERHRVLGPLFRSSGFWIGLALVGGMRIWNGLYVWFEDWLTPIQTRFNLLPLIKLWPEVAEAPWGRSLLHPIVYPIVVGFSYFLASEVAFSVGISQFLYVPLAALLVGYGVDLSTSYMAGGAMGWQRAGAYVAFAIIILYIGRHYYIQVLSSALSGRTREAVPPHAAWACRILMLALVLMVVMMTRLGLDWPIAVLTVGLIMIMFLGVSRITAETGLFFIHPRWQPLGVCLGLFGAYALGPQELVIVGLLCAVLCLDPSQALMPYFVNALRMCEILKVKVAHVAWGGWTTYVACLVVAIVVVLWAQYNFGAPRTSWPYRRVPTMTFRPAARAVDKLLAQDRLAASETLGPVQRVLNIRPQDTFPWWFGTGFVLVLITSAARMRFPRWPLHPVVFLLWATYPTAMLHHSFLLGWLIKVCVLRFGGQALYHRCKPFMAGLIAGEVLGAMTFMVVGAIYYGVQAKLPVSYTVFPR